MSLRAQGFTLIELVIAMTIASFLALGLYRAFYQITQTAVRIDTLLDYTTVMPLVYNQLEKDISAAFVPLRGYPEEKKNEEKKPTDTVTTGTAVTAEKPKKIEKVFYSTNERESLQLMTFISTNPLLGYDEIAPRAVRVTYRLLPDKEQDETFVLTRQESAKLEAPQLKDAASAQSYEIARDIKYIKTRFFVAKEQEQEQKQEKDQKQKQKEKKKEFVEFNDWGTEESSKKTKRLAPDFVMFDGAFWDVKKKREKPFAFMFEVFAHEGKPQEAAPANKPPESKKP